MIIGGGPAGARTAWRTASRGYSTLLLEKRPRVGFPVRCAEAVGPREDVERYLSLDESLISSPVNGVVLVSPGGIRYEAEMPEIGFIVDRELFDRRLAEIAAGGGAVVRTGHQAMGLLRENSRIRGVVAKDLSSGALYQVRSRVTVGADGVESISPRWAGLKTGYRPEELMSCAQELISGIDVSLRYIEFHLGTRCAPGGYAWVFPKGKNSANVGVGINPLRSGGLRATDYLERFIAARCAEGRRHRLVVGATAVARGLPSLVADGYVAVGEAANQNNPFSGGGIINALEGADLAADAILEALESNDQSANRLKTYNKNWWNSVGRTNEIFYQAARILYRLPDGEMDRALARLKREKNLISNKAIKPWKLLKVLLLSRPALVFQVAGSIGKGILFGNRS
ncbi:MAG: NAD(P)/FAD-dependent oxidoreductase [Candidatus Krumholzibacteriota bacterium]|nr:NAD(P)/FAD-dependent oxidoreductase [Candidatus Krumholzibacteriota bacterium]